MMQALKKYGWTLIGLLAMLISIYLLYNKLQNISLEDVVARLRELSFHHWALAVVFALVSYAALAGYDRIALRHLGKHISWIFITLCSFTTYALSHNIGASAFSGALVRYRAYSSKGMTGAEVAVLVAFCSFTFILGTILLSGIVLVWHPDLIGNIHKTLSPRAACFIGWCFIAFIILYILGSLLGLKPLKIGSKFQLAYPHPKIVAQQLIIGPLELIGAAGIIYSVLPGNPDFIVVLGVFLASFTATLLINAPAGGIGVLEYLFMEGMPDTPKADVIAALIVFRLLYLIIPLIISIFIVAAFEIHQFMWRRRVRSYRRKAEAERLEHKGQLAHETAQKEKQLPGEMQKTPPELQPSKAEA